MSCCEDPLLACVVIFVFSSVAISMFSIYRHNVTEGP